MADHVRSQIREEIYSLLKNLSLTGCRVYKNRVYPIADLPGIIIYNGNEESEQDIIGARNFARNFEIKIEGYAKSDDDLDEIAKKVEAALTDQTLGGLSKDLTLISSEFDFSDGEEPSGVITMTYLINYRTTLNAPDIAL